jgi:transcriptional regulator with XRE-family HTH domain
VDGLAEQARRLRREEGLSGRQIQERLGAPKQRVQDWLRGVPPPDWTRRPNAKDELRAKAIALRERSWSVNDIALELDVARSTAWRWVQHLPLDRDSERARRKRDHAKLMTDAQWAVRRKLRDERRDALRDDAASSVGVLSASELIRMGALMYWCEGRKAKPWRRDGEYLVFTNSDPALIWLYLCFLAALDVVPERIKFRVAIHESADVDAVVQWWADFVGVSASTFLRSTLKRHSPTTNRRNTGDGYRGCLVVSVARSRELYWMIEGLVRGVADRAALDLSHEAVPRLADGQRLGYAAIEQSAVV